MKSDVTPTCARPRLAALVTPGSTDSPAAERGTLPPEGCTRVNAKRSATPLPEPPPDATLIRAPQHVLDAHLDYHRGRTAKAAREPLLPDEHQLGTYSVVCGLLVCIPFASGFAAVAMGLFAVAAPSKRTDGDQVLGAFGILVGAANFAYWLWGLLD